MDAIEDVKNKVFIRARRNLIGASLVLLCYQILGVSIKELTIAGVKLEVASPARIDIALWIVFGYFLLRYYQHYRVSRPKSLFDESLKIMVGKAAIAQFRNKYSDSDVPDDIPKPYKLDVDTTSLTILGEHEQEWKVAFNSTVYGYDGTHHAAATGQREEYVLGKALHKAKIKAYLHMAFNTPHATECHLPFLIALTPVLYFICTSISGSLVQTMQALRFYFINR